MSVAPDERAGLSEAIFDGLPCAILLLADDGRIRLCNRRFRKMLGLPAKLCLTGLAMTELQARARALRNRGRTRRARASDVLGEQRRSGGGVRREAAAASAPPPPSSDAAVARAAGAAAVEAEAEAAMAATSARTARARATCLERATLA